MAHLQDSLPTGAGDGVRVRQRLLAPTLTSSLGGGRAIPEDSRQHPRAALSPGHPAVSMPAASPAPRPRLQCREYLAGASETEPLHPPLSGITNEPRDCGRGRSEHALPLPLKWSWFSPLLGGHPQ